MNCIFVQSCTFTVVSRLLHHFYLQCTHSELKACFSLIHGVLQLSCHVYDISYIFFSDRQHKLDVAENSELEKVFLSASILITSFKLHYSTWCDYS